MTYCKSCYHKIKHCSDVCYAKPLDKADEKGINKNVNPRIENRENACRFFRPAQ